MKVLQDLNNQIDKCITSRTIINKSQQEKKPINDVNKQQNKTFSYDDNINPGKENQDQSKIRNKILNLDKQITDRLKKLNKTTAILTDSQENNGFLESILEENSFCESAEKDLEEKQRMSLLETVEENNKRMSFAETKQNVEKIFEEINKRNENKENEQTLKKIQNEPTFMKKKIDENKKLFFEDFKDFNEKELEKNQNIEDPLTARLENNNPDLISSNPESSTFGKNLEISNLFEGKDEIPKDSQELRFFKHIHSFSASKSNLTDEINGRDILQSIKESAKKKQEKMMKELENRRFCPEKEKIMDILKTHRTQKAISNHENAKMAKSHHKNSHSLSETKNPNVEITNFNENNDKMDLNIGKFEEKPKNKEEPVVKNLNDVIFEKIQKTKNESNELFVDKILAKLRGSSFKNEKYINIIENSKNEIISVDQVLRTMKREPIKPTEPFKEFKLNSNETKILEKDVKNDEKRFSLEVFSKENMKKEAEKERKKGGSAYSTPKTTKCLKFIIFYLFLIIFYFKIEFILDNVEEREKSKKLMEKLSQVNSKLRSFKGIVEPVIFSKIKEEKTTYQQ